MLGTSKETLFLRTICPLSFVVIALIFLELRGEGAESPPRSHKDREKPGLNRVKIMNSSETVQNFGLIT